MNFETIILQELGFYHSITLNRPKEKNSLTTQLLLEFNRALDLAEKNNACKVIVIEGSSDYFCSGMDFVEILKLAKSNKEQEIHNWASLYISTLKRLTAIPKIIISKVTGNAFGGGVGLLAASDLVVANKNAQFSLPEALWGLLPAMITPFLIRRIGFQKTYSLTLSSYTIKAEEAKECQLVDDLCDNIEETMQKRLKHFDRLEMTTIRNLKSYFQKMWSLSPEAESTALEEIVRLIKEPKVQQTITNFIEHQQLPWKSA